MAASRPTHAARNRRFRQQRTLENLEVRRLMACELAADAVEVREFNGEISICGTEYPDKITVNQIIDGEKEFLEVTILDLNNVPRYSDTADITDLAIDKINIEARGGGDFIRNNSDIPSEIFGGDGGDYILGGSAADVIWGDGGPNQQGRDQIWGGPGNDTIYGGPERDLIRGGQGDDHLFGDEGNDAIWGDQFHPLHKDENFVPGNDDLHGGLGDDNLFGEGGRDRLFGDPGIDGLYGDDSDDDLYGGTGRDRLVGGAGHDGLYGGADSDSLQGGSDSDRFLLMIDDADKIYDRSDIEGDGVVFFQNGDQIDQREFTYGAGSWLDNEVAEVDLALGELHRRVESVIVLTQPEGLWSRTPEFRPMTLVRHGELLTDVGPDALVPFAWNDSRGTIHFTDLILDYGEGDVEQENELLRFVWHEFGHNWDDTTRMTSEFLSLSGWVQNIDWSHAANATFVTPYAETNGLEDFAESFAAFLMMDTGRRIADYGEAGYGFEAIPAKLEFMSRFFTHLKNLGLQEKIRALTAETIENLE